MNHDWDRKGAEEALTRAVQVGPGSPTAHLWNAWRLALLERRQEEALRELEEAERLDPLDLQVKTQIGYIHHFHHDGDRAIEQFERVLALEPSFAFGHYALADACVQRGHYERAFAEFDRAIELGGRSVNLIGVLGYAYGRSGNRDGAMEHLRELNARAADAYVPAIWMALVHLGLGGPRRLVPPAGPRVRRTRRITHPSHWSCRVRSGARGSQIHVTPAEDGAGASRAPGLSTLLYSRSRWSGNGPNTAGRVRRARAFLRMRSVRRAGAAVRRTLTGSAQRSGDRRSCPATQNSIG